MIMNNFKDKITESADLNQINAGDRVVVGIVRKANEHANCCDIDIVTQYGDSLSRRFVPVTSAFNNGVIDWFPAVGDRVYVKIYNSHKYEIISPCTDEYNSKYKRYLDIKNNLLSNFYNYTVGGYIF